MKFGRQECTRRRQEITKSRQAFFLAGAEYAQKQARKNPKKHTEFVVEYEVVPRFVVDYVVLLYVSRILFVHITSMPNDLWIDFQELRKSIFQKHHPNRFLDTNSTPMDFRLEGVFTPTT